MNNPYCQALGIAVPRLESAKDSPDANYFALLIVALLEHGAPMTLQITTSLLIQGTCGISRSLGDSKTLTRYLKNGEDAPTNLVSTA